MTGLDWRAVIASERDAEGTIKIQPVPNGQSDGGGAGSYKSLLPTSFFARPADAERDAELQIIRSCDALIGEDGEERFVFAMSDGRFAEFLPDPGKGGGGFCGAIPVGTSWQMSYAYFVGTAVSGKTAGSFFIRVPGASSGDHTLKIDRADDTIEVNHAIGHKVTMTPTEMTIEHQAGAKITLNAAGVVVDGTTVQLGGSGGFPVVYDNGALAVFFANLIAGLSGIGIVVAPPAAYSSATTSTRV